MEWIRRRPRVATAAGVVAVIAILFLVFSLARTPDQPASEPLVFPSTTATPTRLPMEDLPTTKPTKTPSTAAQVQRAAQEAFTKFGQGLSSGGLTSGQLQMPGLQGGSVYKYLPKHKVTMRVTSQQPIGTIGYVVPTSLNNSSGVVKNVGNSWSLTTTAYGDPDYAQLFMQAGARGFPITCTITVDGRVTEQRSTEGPYGQLICQG